MRKISFILLFIFILTACGTNNTSGSNDRLLIYTSIYPLQYVVSEIAGDQATAESIFPPGVDAHTYEPTSREITALADGDAFIYIGAGMEGFAETMAEALKSQPIQFVEIGENKQLFSNDTTTDDDHEHDHEHTSDYDPHIWLDPIRMIQVAEMVTEQLSELQPDSQEYFLENLSHFTEEMIVLDEQFSSTLADKEQKEILVSHAAYGYWELRYGIEQIPISGLSSSDEPSQKELASIAKLAEEKNLKHVIFDQVGTNRIASILQDHIKAEALYIHNLEVLTEDDIAANEDYHSIMKKNLDALDKATN